MQARKDQDDRASALAQEFDQRRRQFYARIAPLLVQLMDRAGARAVFDENSALLTDQRLNITDEVIAAIDAEGERRNGPARRRRRRSPAGRGGAGARAPAPARRRRRCRRSGEGRPAPRPEGGN